MAARRSAGLVACGLVALLVSGCAARLPVRRAPEASPGADGRSLSDYMEKLRHLSARPVEKTSAAAAVETRDPALSRMLAALAQAPSPSGHRAVAERYRELGLPDHAYRYFMRAVAGDPADAGAFDGLARVWRDWGLPHLALPEASRAVFHAPSSAAAHNTLGTVLQALGHDQDAARAYERARDLDGTRAYALNNLCYLQFRQSAIERAVASCEAALAIDPAFHAARNNLALAHAAAGRLDVARATLMTGGAVGEGFFNVGILHLARREYEPAAAAFDAASRAEPRLARARTRAAQARELAYQSRTGGVR